MALDTGKLVRKAHCKVIPMTQEVIDRVNYLGRGEKSLLIFHNKRGEEIGERSVLDRVIEADTNEPIEHDMLDVGNDTNLDVVDDVAGVDNPYEEYYVDEWNKDVPKYGDNIINQVAGNNDNSDAGVPVHLEPINNDSDTGVPDDSHKNGLFENDGHFEPITLPTPSASPSATTQDGGGRPTRVRKQVSRLIPSFEGKSYGTTMVQVSGEMVGMTLSQSIKHMELELEAMEPHDGDRRALKGVLLANLSLKQSIKLFGKEKTMASATAEMQQIHWRKSFFPKHYRELTPKQKSRW